MRYMTGGWLQQEGAQVRPGQLQRRDRAHRDDVRNGRLAEQQRGLTEELAPAESRDIGTVDPDADLTVEDDEEARAREALSEDALPGREGLLGHGVGHGLELRAVQVREERQPGQRVRRSPTGSCVSPVPR